MPPLALLAVASASVLADTDGIFSGVLGGALRGALIGGGVGLVAGIVLWLFKKKK